MSPPDKKRKISLRARVLFYLVFPLVILLSLELFARFILPKKGIEDIRNIKLLKPAKGLPPVGNRELYKANTARMFNKTLPEQPFHEFEPGRFYRLKRNNSFTWLSADNRVINYRTNSLGFRGDEFPADKSDGKVRIICTGDSSTFGCFLNTHDTYPTRLKSMLSARTIEKNAEVINAGVVGYSSFQGLKFFESELRALKPDVLIASWGYNDVQKAPRPDSDVRSGTVRSLGFRSKLNKIGIYRLLDKVITRAKKETGAVPMMVTKVSVPEYRENLMKLVSYCREDGIHLIFLPITAPYPYYETMKEIARDNEGVGFIDMEEIFTPHYDRFLKDGATEYKGIPMWLLFKQRFNSEQLERYGSPEMARIREWSYLFLDYCHPTPVGYYIIAESIYKYLVEMDFFTPCEGKEYVPPSLTSFPVELVSIPDITE